MVSENCSYIGVCLLVPYIQNKISQCFFSSTSPCYVWLNMPMKLWTCSWLFKLTMKTGNWILAEPINSPPPCKLAWCPGDHGSILLINFFPSNLNSMENSFCWNSVPGNEITTIFCTCLDSKAVGSWAKFCSNQRIRIWIKRNWNFHWMVCGLLSNAELLQIGSYGAYFI